MFFFSVQYQGRTSELLEVLPWIWFWLCTSQLYWANNVSSLSQSFEIQDGSQQNNPRTLDNFCFRRCDVILCVSSNQRQTSEIRTFDTDFRKVLYQAFLDPLLFSPSPSPLPLGRPDTQARILRNSLSVRARVRISLSLHLKIWTENYDMTQWVVVWMLYLSNIDWLFFSSLKVN